MMSKFVKIAKVKTFTSIKGLCDYLFQKSASLSGAEMVELFYQFNSDHDNVFSDIRVTMQANHKVITFVDVPYQQENPSIGINTHHLRGGQTFPYAGKELAKFLLKAYFLREKASSGDISSEETTDEQRSNKKKMKRRRAEAKFRKVIANKWELL